MRFQTARSSPSYLLQTPHSYYFRIKTPDDLRLFFQGQHEIKRSLKTGYLSDAKYKARLLAGQVQRLFRYLRRKDYNAMANKLPEGMLKEIVKERIQDCFDEFDKEMLESRNRPMTEKQLDDKDWSFGMFITEYTEALARGDYSLVEDVAKKALKETDEDYFTFSPCKICLT